MIAAEIQSYLRNTHYDFGGIILENGKYLYDQADNKEYFLKYLPNNTKISCILVFTQNNNIFKGFPPGTVLRCEPDVRFWLWYHSDASINPDATVIEYNRRFARRSDVEWVVSSLISCCSGAARA